MKGKTRLRKGTAGVLVMLFLLVSSVSIAAETAKETAAEGMVLEESKPLRSDSVELKIPIKLSGYFWVDTGYMERSNTQSGQYDQTANYMQGRFVLAGTYYRELGNFFALAKVELVGYENEYTQSQYEVHTLDSYVKFGQKWWDIQVGRFLAWEVYSRGQGIELYTAEEAGALDGPSMYLLDFTRGHKNEAGQAAVHLFPFDFLKFEVAGVYGQESNQNNMGIRPVADLKLWKFQVVGGYEYLRQSPQTEADKVEVTSRGYAGRLQLNLPVVTTGVDYSSAHVKYININGEVDGEKTTDTTSIGAFIDVDFWKNSIGLGYHHTRQKNKQGEENTHDQMFMSYLFRLPIEGLSLKAVYGFATAHIQDVDANSEWDNDMRSFRLRISYEFK
ncbi:MAG: hypothetical protein EPN93_09840 [Spirochaetes bacterium]|nr:MAG: hypothetical protein EPN93_09840 [Spirochaetota bacterium]